jgi:hypothetical protein
MIEIERRCDHCGNVYLASLKRLERGWSKFCDKDCANTARVAHRKTDTTRKHMNSHSKIKEDVYIEYDNSGADSDAH